MTPVFRAHVEQEVEAAHANGPVGHRCNEMHGHSWVLEAEFAYVKEDLNGYGWGPDFGAVKAIMKRLDHRNLNTFFSFPPSAENIAQWLFREIHAGWPFVTDLRITVHEGGGNTIIYYEES